MSASKECKAAGLKSLAELSVLSEVSRETLNNWYKSKPKLFNLVLNGAIKVKQSNE